MRIDSLSTFSHFPSFFAPSLSFSYNKYCLILSQNVKYGTFVANVTKNLTYTLWEKKLCQIRCEKAPQVVRAWLLYSIEQGSRRHYLKIRRISNNLFMGAPSKVQVQKLMFNIQKFSFKTKSKSECVYVSVSVICKSGYCVKKFMSIFPSQSFDKGKTVLREVLFRCYHIWKQDKIEKYLSVYTFISTL